MSKPALTQQDVTDAIEHQNALLDLRAIFSTPAGKRFFRYLFKNFEVATLPPQGIDGPLLFEKMGFLRAGNSIFELASEADFQIAANLLAQNKKDEYERALQDAQAEHP